MRKYYIYYILFGQLSSEKANKSDVKDLQEQFDIFTNAAESIPSPNLVNFNDTESWPFGISETEAVKGLYSWVDNEGYINIKGTATENSTIFLMFEEGDITFEAGTYYVGLDDVLRTGSASAAIDFDGQRNYVSIDDSNPIVSVTFTESVTVRKIDAYFNSGAVVNFKGHVWITKDEPIDFFAPKGSMIKIPTVPVQKEDIEKLDDYNILGIFDSIGGVGDSLMSGHINPTDDSVGSDTTCYSKSWLSQLSKIIGVDVEHYSYSGATTKNWLQNQNSYYENILTKPCEAYFLALGTNDATDWAGYSLGTIADMGTDTESFYGYYSKVITRIREANPKAPIFMLSYYWTGFSEYDNAIKAISEATENAYYIDITDMNDKYSAYRQGYHFNAIGYYYIAKSIIQRVSEVIISNYQNFANLGVIINGTDSGSGDTETETTQYTNIISTSIGTDGEVFNDGKGWADNSRIGSGGIYLGNGSYYVTGHIPIDRTNDCTIYLKNVTFGENSAVAFFNSSFARITNGNADWLQINDIKNNYFAVVDDSGNLTQFTMKTGHMTNTELVYMAIQADYIGDDSIITINEPIE